MRRREFLAAGDTATLITSTSTLSIAPTSVFAHANTLEANKLTPPADASIPVAFGISRGATMIDFAGPWEVFQDVMLPAKAGPQGHANHRMAFNLYTVSEKTEPIEASAGMKIVPDYTFETGPAPNVLVISAQAGSPPVSWWRGHRVETSGGKHCPLA